MTDIADAVRLLGEHGIQTFPVHGLRDGACTCGRKDCTSPGKHPLSKGWQGAASCGNVEAWNALPDANMGVACGEASNLTVIDVDGQAGIDSLRDLAIETGVQIPKVPKVVTGKGWYLYFAYTPGLNNRVGIRPGLDIRSTGAFVVGPGSAHVSGRRYHWHQDVPLDEHPRVPIHNDWVSALNSAPQQTVQPSTTAICKGERNSVLFHTGVLMARSDIPQAQIEAGLAGINLRICSPPLPEFEIAGIATSVPNYAASQPTLCAPLTTAELMSEPVPPMVSLDVFGRPGFAIAGSVHLLAGHPKCGKTTLAFELLTQWSNSRILYATADESRTIVRQRTERYGGVDRLGHVTWLCLHGPDKDGVIAQLRTRQYDLVVIDTLRSVFGFEEENNNSAVTRELQPALSVCRELGVTALLLHHLRKSADRLSMRGVSGASNLTGLVDIVLLLGGERLKLIAEGRGVERAEMKLTNTGGRIEDAGGASRVLVALSHELQGIDQIREKAGIDKTALPDILDQLVSTGAAILEVRRNPNTGRTARGYRLPDSAGR